MLGAQASSRGKFQPQMWKRSRVKYTVEWIFWKGKRKEKTKILLVYWRVGRVDTQENPPGRAESFHDLKLWVGHPRKAWISCLCLVLWAKIFSNGNKMKTKTFNPQLYFPEVWLRTYKKAGAKCLWFQAFLTWGINAGQCSWWLYLRRHHPICHKVIWWAAVQSAASILQTSKMITVEAATDEWWQ